MVKKWGGGENGEVVLLLIRKLTWNKMLEIEIPADSMN